MPELLSDTEIADGLATLPGWTQDGSAISKTWERKGFLGVVNLANAIAFAANELNHHPDLFIHGYNKLTVTLTTHSAGGITANDLHAARVMENLTNVASSAG
ncbi:4a-hydroxytetrahydrobiopterin dehydratase [Haloechinothrix sp. LS1_15]|uniref:4a-hydroxytetrahydrobiopterin dehydratase n=1 Tax=Haloechinothrix sp. LS1_15 TaxID=2652248 RepID=UPI002946D235|nr:4a-hydroxytetrahydrobiopterin dehydratase [Haloechinothrix sp. LS1_15]MDV6012404.1 4a-hydroxytetrahydrobiopterin dehydratase [Haloechinothrix sp. LS1_15]